ncbi:MAG: hypothetical protein HY774_27495 [Acidobacteria bacterium]|nr:hypothetical protein [Acidobacteriota bacterium]
MASIFTVFAAPDPIRDPLRYVQEAFPETESLELNPLDLDSLSRLILILDMDSGDQRTPLDALTLIESDQVVVDVFEGAEVYRLPACLQARLAGLSLGHRLELAVIWWELESPFHRTLELELVEVLVIGLQVISQIAIEDNLKLFLQIQG